MDEFRRMMEMQGVVPIGARRPGGQPSKTKGSTQAPAPRPAVKTPDHVGQSPPVDVPQAARQAWATGPTARSALDVALRRVRDGDGSGWAIAVLADGTTRPLPTHQGAVRLLGDADRLGARLVIIASGKGDTSTRPFTFVMHPMMGIATLDDDPEEQA